MSNRPKYKTKQRQILIDFLKSRSGAHVSASDVCEHFRTMGASIGQSTVYRQLETLVDEGVVSKYMVDPSSPACFEYTGGRCHEDEHTCFHCKCEKCGKLIHLHCYELEAIKEHLYKGHSFELDIYRTVFYGLCEECGKAAVNNDTVTKIRK